MSTLAMAALPVRTRAEDLLAEVLQGLAQRQKRLPPKLFYDAEGSRLFERICEQPEYYLTRTETALLQRHACDIAAWAGPRCVIIEPGAGVGEKTPLLLHAAEDPVAYVPVEISPEALQRCAEQIRDLLPRLRVLPLCADFTRPFAPPRIEGAQWRRRLLFFPGSTIGNFDPADARRLLAAWREAMGPRAGLVAGVDLRKPRVLLERAYDDAAGVTARFNLHLLERLNQEFGADFDLQCFSHHAFYDEQRGRVEMHLQSRRPQRVRLAGRSFVFAAGETIHTENSYKYTPADFAELALAAGWVRRRLWVDEQQLFSIHCFDAQA